MIKANNKQDSSRRVYVPLPTMLYEFTLTGIQANEATKTLNRGISELIVLAADTSVRYLYTSCAFGQLTFPASRDPSPSAATLRR